MTWDSLPVVPPAKEDPRERFGNHEGGNYENPLADDGDMDPVAVAICKRLHDLQVSL